MELFTGANIGTLPQGLTVTVYDAQVSGHSYVDGDKATIYEHDGSALANPFEVDVNGRFEFAAADGKYDIKLGGAGDSPDTTWNSGSALWLYAITLAETLPTAPAMFAAEVTSSSHTGSGTLAAVNFTSVTFEDLPSMATTGTTPITIPPGCNRAIVSAYASTAANTPYYMGMQINGSVSGQLAYKFHDQESADTSYIRDTICSGVVEVVAGETIDMKLSLSNTTNINSPTLRVVAWNSLANSGRIPAMFAAQVSVASFSTPTAWTSQDVNYDTVDFEDTEMATTGTTPITIPPGCDRAIISVVMKTPTAMGGFLVQAIGSTSGEFMYHSYLHNHNDTRRLCMSSGVVEAVPGETVKTVVQVATGSSTVESKLRVVAWNSQSPRASSFKGALVSHSTTQNVNSSSSTELDFDTESYDTDGFHESVTNPKRLTVPAGVSKVKVSAGYDMALNATGVRAIWIRKNGGDWVGLPKNIIPASSSIGGLMATSPVVDVVEGDYFTAVAWQNSGSALNVQSSGTWFAIEVVE